jgi:hypothetical protein
MSWKRSIITTKSRKKVLNVLKGLGIKDYSLKSIRGKKIKITLETNLETCRKIINYLEE